MVHTYTAQVEAFERYHIDQAERTSGAVEDLAPALPALGHALSGAAGSAIGNTITYPLALIITRLQVQSQIAKSRGTDAESLKGQRVGYTDALDAVQRIYNEEGGISAFYTGCVQDTAKTVVDSFLFFLAYNFVRNSRMQAMSSRRLPAHEEIGVGMVAGAFAKLITTPMSNIVTRKQTASMFATQVDQSSDVKYLSTANIAKQIYKDRGLKGFWAGYSASLVLTVNPALTMLVNNILTRFFVPRAKREDPGIRITFLLAALSKAFASSVTYPFQLAKSRLQVAGRITSYETGKSDPTAQSGIGEKIQNSSTVQPKKATIIGTVLTIAQDEGILGLYKGLSGEIIKGFFQHGFTMLMKDKVHIAVVHLYYLLFNWMQLHPPPQIAANAKAQAEKLAKDSASALSNASSSAQETATNIVNSSISTVSNLPSTISNNIPSSISNLSSTITNAGQSAGTTVKDDMSSLGEASQKMLEEVAARSQRSVGDVREKVKEMSGRVVDVMIELIKEGKNAKADFEASYIGLGDDDD